MKKRKRSMFYRPQLSATRRRKADPLVPVVCRLVRLEALYELAHSYRRKERYFDEHRPPARSPDQADEQECVAGDLSQLIEPANAGQSGSWQLRKTDQSPKRVNGSSQAASPGINGMFGLVLSNTDIRPGPAPVLQPPDLTDEPPPLTSEECFDFLASLGALFRSRLFAYVWSSIGPTQLSRVFPVPTRVSAAQTRWRELAREYKEVLRWAVQTYENWGAVLAYYALAGKETWRWLERAQQIEPETELADPKYADYGEICRLAEKVQELWIEFDDVDLVCALTNKSLLLLAYEPSENFPAPERQEQAVRSLDEILSGWQDELMASHEWLHQHQETFFLAATYIQSVAAGFHPELRKDCELFLTGAKYASMLDALEIGEGVAQCLTQPYVLLRTTNGETTMSKDDSSRPDAFPRSELEEPLLAAASSAEAPPKMLVWRSPDQRYVACLTANRKYLVLRFFTESGTEAAILEGEPVRLAGVETNIGEHGLVIIPLSEFLKSKDDLYLEVGREKLRWHPVRRDLPD